MLKRILPYLFVLIAVMLDVSVLPVVAHSYFTPLCSLCTVVALALLLGRSVGTLLGLAGGLLIDVLVGSPLGLMTLLYVGSGYLSGLIGRKLHKNILFTVVAPILCATVLELTMIVYLYLAGAQIEPVLFGQAGIRVALEVVLVQFLYLFYNRILKPRWSRYQPG